MWLDYLTTCARIAFLTSYLVSNCLLSAVGTILCIVSADVDRVMLSTDNDQPDYINACFLDVRWYSEILLIFKMYY